MLVLGAAAIMSLAGCRKVALRDDDRRTQFDQYDSTRNEYVTPYVTDEFGRKIPNLRGRLTQRDD